MSQPQLPPLPARSAQAVHEATQAAALRLERGVCLGRIVFLSIILARFFAVTTTHPGGKVLTSLPILMGVAFSVHVLLFVKRSPGPWFPWVSVSIDATAVFCALLANALWPTPEYPGILNSADSAALLISTMGAGLRLSPAVAIFGGVINLFVLFVLVIADRIVSGDRFAVGIENVSIFLVWIAGAAMIAFLLARTTRYLAIQGAKTAVQVERAERGLWAMLASHHDVGSMLTSARIDAQLIVEDLKSTDLDQAKRASQRLDRVVTDICGIVSVAKNRAIGTIAEQEPLEAVSLRDAVQDVVDRIGKRFPDVDIRYEIPPETQVMVSGGRRAGLRMLFNIIENACEGSGERSPTYVEVDTQRDPRSQRIVIQVKDNGPGLQGTPKKLQSTKAAGTGVGLQVVRGLTEASGGSFQIKNREQGGCKVVLQLPEGGRGKSKGKGQRAKGKNAEKTEKTEREVTG